MSKLRSFFKELPIDTLIFNSFAFLIVPAFLHVTGIVHYGLRELIITIGALFAWLFLVIGISFCLYCYFLKKGGEV